MSQSTPSYWQLTMKSEALKPSSDFVSDGKEAICSVSCCIEENCCVGASLSGNLLPLTLAGATKLGSDDIVGVGGGAVGKAQVTASATEDRLQMPHLASQQRQQHIKLIFSIVSVVCKTVDSIAKEVDVVNVVEMVEVPFQQVCKNIHKNLFQTTK